MTPRFAAIIVILACCAAALGADENTGDYLKRPADWFAGNEARNVARRVISWQTPTGGWAKGAKVHRMRGADEGYGQWGGLATFDNGCTFSEIRLLARIHRASGDDTIVPALERAIDFVLDAQYPNGGWPQRWPPPRNYGANITFNDNAMVNVMRLVRDIAQSPDFAFADAERRQRARAAFDRGIECILAAQIRVDGQPTAWCAQHDPQTLAPARGRAYELPSISGCESAPVVLLLMEIDNPSPEVQQAIEGAVAWFEQVKITGQRLERREDPKTGKPDLYLVDDPAAPPLWARFYEIGTNQPMFLDRDGTVYARFSDLEREPRTGYAWLRHWGQKVLDAYPKWKARNAQARS